MYTCAPTVVLKYSLCVTMILETVENSLSFLGSLETP